MIIFILLLGLAVGSFVGAYSYREPRGLSVWCGRSVCPKCKARIAWYDNLPLISFLALKAKCRSCRKQISPRYFIIELAGLIGFVSVFLSFPYLTQSLVWVIKLPYFIQLVYVFFVMAALIAIFVIDWEHKLILDENVFFPFLATVVILAFFVPENLYEHLLAGFGSSLFLLVVHLITKGRGMGLGDVKLALFLGTVAGIWGSFVYMFWAFIVGALTGITLIFLGKKQMSSQIAFGPFMIIGFVIFLLTSSFFAHWFLFF